MACWICARRKLEILQSVFPYLLIGWIASLMMAGEVNTLMMGEDVMKGLGQRTILMKSFVLLIIVLLSGGSVAVAGNYLLNYYSAFCEISCWS